MARTGSWESVARALASRMVYQANACPVGSYQTGTGQDPGHFAGEPEEFHNPDEHVEDCPFCADTVAYRRFLARAAGQPYRPTTTQGATR